jgi:hypothetical protein
MVSCGIQHPSLPAFHRSLLTAHRDQVLCIPANRVVEFGGQIEI